MTKQLAPVFHSHLMRIVPTSATMTSIQTCVQEKMSWIISSTDVTLLCSCSCWVWWRYPNSGEHCERFKGSPAPARTSDQFVSLHASGGPLRGWSLNSSDPVPLQTHRCGWCPHLLSQQVLLPPGYVWHYCQDWSLTSVEPSTPFYLTNCRTSSRRCK